MSAFAAFRMGSLAAVVGASALLLAPGLAAAFEWEMTPPPGYGTRRPPPPPPPGWGGPPAPRPYINDEPDYRQRPYGVRPHRTQQCRNVERWVPGPYGPQRVIDRRCR